MSDSKIFIDSNIVIYAHSDSNIKKQHAAQDIITNNHSVISTQVVQEVANFFYKKTSFGWDKIEAVVHDICSNNEVHTNSPDTILLACRISDRYKYSFYDSLIIASAFEANCDALYSEDMQSNQVLNLNHLIDLDPADPGAQKDYSNLLILNPFTA